MSEINILLSVYIFKYLDIWYVKTKKIELYFVQLQQL